MAFFPKYNKINYKTFRKCVGYTKTDGLHIDCGLPVKSGKSKGGHHRKRCPGCAIRQVAYNRARMYRDKRKKSRMRASNYEFVLGVNRKINPEKL